MHISPATKITLLLISMLTMMSNVAIVTMLPHLNEHFEHIENIELFSRLMITLPSLAIALLSPFLGHLVYKIGKKRASVIALILFSLFGTAGLYLQDIYNLLFSRFLFGIAIALLMIIATTLIGDYFKNEARHKFMGTQSAFISIGGIMFIVGGGILSDIDWRYPFGIYILGLFVLVFVIKYLVEINTHEQKEEDDTYLNHNLWYIYLLAFILMLVFYILPTQMPFLMINVFGASGTLTGAIIAMAFVFNALGAISFAKFKAKFHFSSIYLIGMGIIATGFILIGNVNNVYFFFLTSPIMGFGGGLLMANMTSWMLDVAHHTKRIKASAYLSSAYFFGQFCSPLATMPLVRQVGIKNFFIVSGVILFIVILIGKFFTKSRAT
ncbi:MFS transporter [Sulfurimonas lithotrophica]|uniref:MFS transporter n=1 Tax=Sulfurimonas lithotrophica TaxID=2590022 RepID=A0A5P8P052_9BACT|nr:MFS transporter [Sulfurimonas lithotrophica]QFR49064.1 MFS transporter [Sulfurimonas lithotrophica]